MDFSIGVGLFLVCAFCGVATQLRIHRHIQDHDDAVRQLAERAEAAEAEAASARRNLKRGKAHRASIDWHEQVLFAIGGARRRIADAEKLLNTAAEHVAATNGK